MPHERLVSPTAGSSRTFHFGMVTTADLIEANANKPAVRVGRIWSGIRKGLRTFDFYLHGLQAIEPANGTEVVLPPPPTSDISSAQS